MTEELGAMAERVDALFGGGYWLRQRIWFWHQREYERQGWQRSRSEGRIRPVMVKRCDGPADEGEIAGGLRADVVARQIVHAGIGLEMIAMQEANKVLRHCAIGRVWKRPRAA